MIDASVQGVSSMLRELGRIDPLLRREATESLRAALQPMADAARQFVPADPPLSGLRRGRRIRWTPRASTGITGAVSTKKDRAGRIDLARIVQRDATGAMFDMAGKRGGTTDKGRRMIRVMSERNGAPSRAMWRPEALYRAQTEQALTDAVRNIEDMLNRGGR